MKTIRRKWTEIAALFLRGKATLEELRQPLPPLTTFKFREIQTGRLRKVKAKDLEAAFREVEKDYSDPLHAWQDWASMDV